MVITFNTYGWIICIKNARNFAKLLAKRPIKGRRNAFASGAAIRSK